MGDFFKLVQRNVKFDRSRFEKDIAIFASKKEGSSSSDVDRARGDSLDFFGSKAAAGKLTSSSKNVAPTTEDAASDEEEQADVGSVSDSSEDVAPAGDVRDAKGNRKLHHINVRGSDVPPPFIDFARFATAGVPDYLTRNLQQPIPEGLGYAQPTPIQMQAIPVLLKRRELLACAPTGSGKTAAFLIPALTLLKQPGKVGLRAVVLSPTRELSEQIYRQLLIMCRGRKWRCFHLTKANAKSFSEPDSSKRKDVLVTTPMRLVHLIKESGIDLSAVELLVLDEADRLLESRPGEEGFDEQIDAILSACSGKHCNRAMFSATMPQGIERLASTFLRDPIRITIGARNSAAVSVKQELVFVGREDGKLDAFRALVQKGLKLPTLVFVQSKDRATQLYTELAYDGLKVDVIHSDRTLAQRSEVIQKFRGGEVWVLICTELMARGIDFKGVSTVINFDFPQSTVSYIHRVGRSGRAGREGHAVTFFTESDAPLLRSIAGVMHASGCDIPEWMLDLGKNEKTRKKIAHTAPNRPGIKTQTGAKSDASKSDTSKRKRKRTEATGQNNEEGSVVEKTEKGDAPKKKGKTKKDLLKNNIKKSIVQKSKKSKRND
jgi:ATP-dependent RNA helicase DDX52/ROK1